MMRLLLACLAFLIALLPGHAQDKVAGRRSVPIAGGWVLTADKHEKSKTDGAQTLLLTATGSPVLKRVSKLIGGVQSISAKAEIIECDFVKKKLILRGSPEFRELDPKTNAPLKTVTGEAATVIEVPFRYGSEGTKLEIIGRNTVKFGPGDPLK